MLRRRPFHFYSGPLLEQGQRGSVVEVSMAIFGGHFVDFFNCFQAWQLGSNFLCRFIASLAACPLPVSPMRKNNFPIAANRGFSFSMAASSPPTIKISVPLSAAAFDPVMGAST